MNTLLRDYDNSILTFYVSDHDIKHGSSITLLKRKITYSCSWDNIFKDMKTTDMYLCLFILTGNQRNNHLPSNSTTELLVWFFSESSEKYTILHWYIPSSLQTGFFIINTAARVEFGAMSSVLLSYKGCISLTTTGDGPPGSENIAISLNLSPICFCHLIFLFEISSFDSLW